MSDRIVQQNPPISCQRGSRRCGRCGFHRERRVDNVERDSGEMTGHLFISGDLTQLACDAILVPTDATFHITKHWRKLLRGNELPESWGGAAGRTK